MMWLCRMKRDYVVSVLGYLCCGRYCARVQQVNLWAFGTKVGSLTRGWITWAAAGIIWLYACIPWTRVQGN